MSCSINILQQQFTRACTKLRTTPDMAQWVPKIRALNPKGAFYVIIYQYVASSGSDMDSFIFFPNQIKWPGDQSNDPEFRAKYFHSSTHDSNIWILKKEYRGDSSVLQKILIPLAYKLVGLCNDCL